MGVALDLRVATLSIGLPAIVQSCFFGCLMIGRITGWLDCKVHVAIFVKACAREYHGEVRYGRFVGKSWEGDEAIAEGLTTSVLGSNHVLPLCTLTRMSYFALWCYLHGWASHLWGELLIL
jgi:hypothetical protein